MNGVGNEIIVADMRGRADRVTATAALALDADFQCPAETVFCLVETPARQSQQLVR